MGVIFTEIDYMQRILLDHLKKWLVAANRKPAVLRGARQVGKTWLVRELAKLSKYDLIELNFEKYPELIAHFSSNDPQKIILNLESFFNKTISLKKTILFLDEIQAAPDIFAKLRWFYEDTPELAIIAAGSLLEFVLEKHTFSMPVGRIQYFFLEPLNFEEFLLAKTETHLLNTIKTFSFNDPINAALHARALHLFKEYVLIGGIPEAVLTWINSASLEEVAITHSDLINTYQDDFNKYTKKIAGLYLPDLLKTIPRVLGQKFIYNKVNSNARTENIKESLHLLKQARICTIVQGCYANGIPLGADINPKAFKVILLDTGLTSKILDLKLYQFDTISDICLINNGAIAEQVVGQLLKQLSPYYTSPELYYWNREVPGSSAEVDYIIQHNQEIIPIEVKAGTEGKLRSLHQFMYEKNKTIAIRLYSGEAKIQKIMTTVSGHQITYTLISLPFYLISQLTHIINNETGSGLDSCRQSVGSKPHE